MSKKKEEKKELSDEEVVKQFLELHSTDNRHVRRMQGKFIKMKIPGKNIPWKKQNGN
jgi:hypothetical protein